MPTNFPGAFDTNVELGGLFINVLPVVDPQRNIDAGFRNNSNDAMFAIQARIGVDDSLVTSSLTWATLGAGGTQNRGLQFATSSATWPGQVADSGIFLDSGTNFPAFHFSGDPAATFYGLVADLQIAYDNGNTITTAGGNPIAIDGTEDVSITLAATKSLVIDGDTTDHTDTDGLLDIVLGVGGTDVMAVNASANNSANNMEFGNFYATITNTGDLAAGETIYGYKSIITMNGDGPVGFVPANGMHFYAGTNTFGGANNYLTVGLYVDSTNDYGVALNTGTNYVGWANATDFIHLSANMLAGGVTPADGLVYTAMLSGDQTAIAHKTLMYQATVASGGDQLGGTSEYVNLDSRNASSAPLLVGGTMYAYHADHVTDAADDATSIHATLVSGFSFENGAGTNDTGPNAYGVYIDMPESLDVGGNYHNNDGTYAFSRWAMYVNTGEAKLRRTYWDASSTLAKAMLHIHQVDEDEPFINFDGSGAANTTLNLTDYDGVGAVEGPKVDAWTFVGMFRIEIVDDNTVLTDGDYWVPFFTAI